MESYEPKITEHKRGYKKLNMFFDFFKSLCVYYLSRWGIYFGSTKTRRGKLGKASRSIEK